MLFCQIIALIVVFNVLFNKKWHEAYKKRAERGRQYPVWLILLMVSICFLAGFMLSKPYKKSKDTQNQSYSQVH